MRALKFVASSLLLGSIWFLSLTSYAEPVNKKKSETNKIFIDIIPIDLQYRYEDSSEQERAMRLYKGYELGGQWNDYRLALQWSQFSQKTGTAAIQIETEFQEYLLQAGYQLAAFKTADAKQSLSLFVHGDFGSTQTRVSRSLYSQSQSDQTVPELVLGLGGSALARIYYLLLQSEVSMLSSRNMSPKEVMRFDIKLGLSIPL